MYDRRFYIFSQITDKYFVSLSSTGALGHREWEVFKPGQGRPREEITVGPNSVLFIHGILIVLVIF